MSETVLEFPPPTGRPRDPEWNEAVHFSNWLEIGINKVRGDDVWVTYRVAQDRTDVINCVSQDVAVVLLTQLFAEIWFSNVADNLSEDEGFFTELAQHELRRVLRRLAPMNELLNCAAFPHVDDVIDIQRHVEDQRRLMVRRADEDAAFAARLAELDRLAMPEGAPV